MDAWYYAADNTRYGPITGDLVQQLAARQVIKPDTPMWREGMAKWMSYEELMGAAAPVKETPAPAAVSPTLSAVADLPLPANVAASAPAVGAEASTPTAAPEKVEVEPQEPVQASVVATVKKEVAEHRTEPKRTHFELDHEKRLEEEDKDRFVQEALEGVDRVGTDWQYAGFWHRFGAGIVDIILFGVLLKIASYLAIFVIGFMFAAGLLLWIPIFIIVFQLALVYAYWVWPVARGRGTRGQRLCSLHVIRGDGSDVGHGVATMRLLASYLSSVTLGIGYLMMLFDREKRTLHDMATNTRVLVD